MTNKNQISKFFDILKIEYCIIQKYLYLSRKQTDKYQYGFLFTFQENKD